MARIRAPKQKKISSWLRSLSRRKFSALMGAALLVPGLGLDASAQTVAKETTVRFQFAHYQDWQKGGDDRIKVQTPQGWVLTPLSDKDELQVGYVYDSVSGASPYYLNSLSGASGTGIHDTRRALNAKWSHYFERFSVGLGGSVSSEDDYLSRGGSLDARWWTEDKNTVIAFGVGGHADHITSTVDDSIDQHRRTQEYLLGLTQVINQRSLVQSNIQFSLGDGYFSEPYKPLDNRPRSRDSIAWLTRYNLFFPEYESSLHADYRLYGDSWNVMSHTLELSYHQPVGAGFTLRPLLRYYTQRGADFYTSVFPPENIERFLTADERLAGFGGITTGLGVIKDFGSGYSADFSVAYLQQKNSFKLGAEDHSNISPFYAYYLTIGLTKKF